MSVSGSLVFHDANKSKINFLYMGEFLSKMWLNFRWLLGRVPIVGGAAMAKAELPMQLISN